MLIIAGLALVAVGLLVSVVPIRFGRLPGDIAIRGKNTAFYFPITTCILLSVILSLIFWILRR